MRVLALSPHTDDAELGCGATLAHWAAAGATVQVAAFSACGNDLLPGEFSAATARLGAERAILHDYPRRCFFAQRQTILDDLLALGAGFQPDIVLAPSPHDAHQDHQVVSAEAFRAFRRCSLWGYELPWNHTTFQTTAFVRVTAADMTAKQEALACYRSQRDLGRPYFDPGFVEGLARVRGVQVGAPFAEAFEVVREVR